MNRKRRSGFSLLEVLLATTILMGSVIVLAELASIGRAHIEDAAGLSTAQLICQTKLNEMLAGAAPVEIFEERPVVEHPNWVYSVAVNQVTQPGLAELRVAVWYQPIETAIEVVDVSGMVETRHENQFSLVRWIRDPGVRSAVRPQAEPTDSLLPMEEFGLD